MVLLVIFKFLLINLSIFLGDKEINLERIFVNIVVNFCLVFFFEEVKFFISCFILYFSLL